MADLLLRAWQRALLLSDERVVSDEWLMIWHGYGAISIKIAPLLCLGWS